MSLEMARCGCGDHRQHSSQVHQSSSQRVEGRFRRNQGGEIRDHIDEAGYLESLLNRNPTLRRILWLHSNYHSGHIHPSRPFIESIRFWGTVSREIPDNGVWSRNPQAHCDTLQSESPYVMISYTPSPSVWNRTTGHLTSLMLAVSELTKKWRRSRVLGV